jgi:hypothetical protein
VPGRERTVPSSGAIIGGAAFERARILLLFLALFFSWSLDAQARPSPSMKVLEAEPAQVLREAPRFPDNWSIREGLYAVVAGDPRDLGTLLRLSAHAESSVPRIAKELGLPPGARMRVYLARSEAQFRDLQPGEPPRWADGTAWPASALIYLKAPRLRPGTAKPLEDVLDHEIVHVVLGQAFGPRPVPTWLQEGLTQLVQREFSPEMTRSIARGSLGKKLLTLPELDAGFPEDPLRAQLAYAQSADFLAFMRNRYGEEALERLIREMASGASVSAAVRLSTGEFLEDVDLAWRSRLERSDLWVSGLVQDNLWWGVGAVLIVVGGLLRMRRKRERMRAWEREEALQRAAFRFPGTDSPQPPPPFEHPVPPPDRAHQDETPRPGDRWVH